jgi:ribosomal protein S12 methylthiotransferase accessory factor
LENKVTFDEAGSKSARLTELVSSRVGVIRTLSKVQRGAEEPCPPYIYQAALSHFDYRMVREQDRIGAGKGRTESEAMLGALGEAVERYCASHVYEQAMRCAPWNTVRGCAIAPPEFVLYSNRQYAQKNFAYRQWAPQDAVRWLRVCELPSGDRVFAPAALVYLAWPSPRAEDSFTAPTSNGLAAGPELDWAILNGLFELIERDAFLITWMARLPAPKVQFGSLPALGNSIRKHYASSGIEIQVFHMCTDLPVHVMMAIAIDRTGTGPGALVGLGCHFNPGAALLKSLFELCQVRPGEVRRFRENPPAERLKRYQDVKTLEDHSAYLTVPERLGEFAFLLENGCNQSFSDLPDYSTGNLKSDLGRCVEILRAAGCRVVYADVTTPDLAGYRIRAVRTLATGLQPIHFGYAEERLGGRRLFELPKRLGFTSNVLSETDLNPCPHPLS